MSDWVTYATTSFQLAFSLSGKSDFIETFFKILIAFIPTQLPIGIIEGFITSASVVIFMKKTNILDKTVAKEIKI